jgi:peptidoglycan/LPS O-acetylase OafA/YrhL
MAKPISFAKTNASLLLDLIRGLAALIVLFEHWRFIVFVDFKQIPTHRALWYPLYALCGAGHQAVVIFFVLSGYLISSSVFRMCDRGAWNWKLYLTHRVLRLWIVVIPGLLLCALWDGLGLHLHVAPSLYAGMSGNHIISNVAARYSVPIFFSNIFFLQGIHSPPFGSDGPLWSLSMEFWYYILFPLGFFAVRPGTSVVNRVLCVLGFAAVAWFTWGRLTWMFLIWLLGTLLAVVPPPRLGQGARIAAAIVYVPLFFLLSPLHRLPLPVIDYTLGCVTVIFLWILLSATSPAQPSFGERSARTLSRFSFTLYVCHTPLLVLLVALILGDTRWNPNLPHLLAGAGLLALCLLYAYLVGSLTEFRTDRVRSWLEARFFAQKA